MTDMTDMTGHVVDADDVVNWATKHSDLNRFYAFGQILALKDPTKYGKQCHYLSSFQFKPLDDVILPSISSYRHMVTSPWGPLLVSRDHGGGLEHRAWHLHTLCPNCQAEDGGAIGDVSSRL